MTNPEIDEATARGFPGHSEVGAVGAEASSAYPPEPGGAGAGQRASDEARQVAGAATEQGRQVATTAATGAKEVASEAREQVSQVVQEASTQARNLVSDSRSELRQQASSQTDRLAGGLRNAAEQVQALIAGRPEEAGAARDYARQVGDKISELADRLDNRGFDGLVDDLQQFARRRPGAFLLGAAALGFATGRLVRGAKAAGGGSEQERRHVGDTGVSATSATPSRLSGVSSPAAPLSSGASSPVLSTPSPLEQPKVDLADVAVPGEDSGAIVHRTSGPDDYAEEPYGQPGSQS